MSSYIQKTTRFIGISHISSPEIGFLKKMNGIINKAKTKLIFKFLEADAVEPTTKQTFSSILKDLSSVKSFASGILVPKEYIWPLSKDQYLQTPTSVVADAHKQGLEVYAYGFANDMPGSYNYSYDPTAEYLQFVDNSEFSVDGVLTDFPPTASEAIGETIPLYSLEKINCMIIILTMDSSFFCSMLSTQQECCQAQQR